MAEYIEREALVHHFMTKRQYLTKDLVMDAAYEISKFPAVDVALVVRGEWVERQEFLSWCEDDVDVFWECSVCETGSCGKSNYCPNCGARMDGE